MQSIKTANLIEANKHQNAAFGFASRTRAPSSSSSLAMISASSPAAWAVGHAVGGALGAPIVAKAVKSWYKKIDLPPWTPPDRLFAPTWTALYSAMGVAAYRVYQRTGCSLTSTPMKLWLVHYFLFNLPWAPAFFGMKRLRLGLVLNFLMVGSLVGLIIPLFYANNALSGLLLLPYLGWLSFATVLNYAICKRNPTDKDGYNAAKFQAGLEALQKEAATYAGVD
jgi:tryptophan-rich sensory protein